MSNKRIINPAEGCTARTIKAQYFKNGVANFIRSDGLGATAVMEYEER
jgi:hypothetical protein